jgi:hypothetical protein
LKLEHAQIRNHSAVPTALVALLQLYPALEAPGYYHPPLCGYNPFGNQQISGDTRSIG